jgi:type I restriction enzyme S subunit
MRGSRDAEFAYTNDKRSVVVSKDDLLIICDGSKSGDMFSGFEGILSSTMGKFSFDKNNIDSNYLRMFLGLNFNLFNTSKKGCSNSSPRFQGI